MATNTKDTLVIFPTKIHTTFIIFLGNNKSGKPTMEYGNGSANMKKEHYMAEALKR
ncbi:unnamed protein product [Sphenostylis stenocarpa]|uniref:Uncharacterized protein n=1 Tax=Sphenostylis stenocarpa TaxID=92480 RepID=A0AA86V7Q8_9FABA|nr:unnamed protein product [Sphenostylis stenocarpa]